MNQSALSHITVIVPILNEAERIGRMLDQLLPLCDVNCDVVWVDGGSTDGTAQQVSNRTNRLLSSKPGRACQMATAVQAGVQDIVWFLHADTIICPNALALIRAAIAEGSLWGRFDVNLSGDQWVFKVISLAINTRSRLTGICTGDQGIFVTQSALDAVGGVPLQPLMEDVELTKRLKRLARPACIRVPLITSDRRWRLHGVIRTVCLMWWLRLSYFLGASPDYLYQLYYGDNSDTQHGN